MSLPVRIDRWLRLRYPGLRRRHIEEALDARLVISAGGAKLGKGDPLDPRKPPDCSGLDRHLAILREGNLVLDIKVLQVGSGVVVVDKPPGIPSHPISLFDTCTVTHWALARYPELRDWATDHQPTVTPHRLDNDTSGVLLVARTRTAFDAWRRRFSAGRVTKRYLAWCWGRGPASTHEIAAGIAHAADDEKRMVVIRGTKSRHRGRIFEARTTVRTIRQFRDRYLCEATMQTGVTHQIRAHLASLGTPLLGDRLYDPAYEQRQQREARTMLRCVFLACGELSVEAASAEFEQLYGTP